MCVIKYVMNCERMRIYTTLWHHSRLSYELDWGGDDDVFGGVLKGALNSIAVV